MKLKKIIDTDNFNKSNFSETWHINGQQTEVDITIGKECDIFDLKKNVLSNFNEKLSEIKRSREQIYKNKENNVLECPICEEKTNSRKEVNIYNADYHKCNNCGHLYVANRPSSIEISNFYKNNKSYSNTYTNFKKSSSRIKNVITDKVNWTLSKYNKFYNRDAKSVLDVGCGGGHFVKSCQNAGLNCDGIEISDDSINFAKEVFELDLIHGDLNSTKIEKKYDLITLWGIIEHVENPVQLIKSCKKYLTNQGMIVVTSPNLNSLSSHIQTDLKYNIIRHLDPLGHIHVFSEKSMCKMLLDNDLTPKFAWYFGMDGYETIVQTNTALNKNKPISPTEELKALSSSIQQFIDKHRVSDSFAFACV